MTNDDLRNNLKKSHILGQHCQRNYDLTQKMPDVDVDVIIHAATNCPSKQNLDFYSVVAIQNREIIEQIYQVTDTGKGRKNPQVLGQLLLVFVSNPDRVSLHERNDEARSLSDIANFTDESNTRLFTDMHQAIGVAAGFVNVTSSMLGYRCGCNKCFEPETVKEILNLSENEEPILMMGVGIHDQNRNRREEHNEGFLVGTFKKIPIKVRKID